MSPTRWAIPNEMRYVRQITWNNTRVTLHVHNNFFSWVYRASHNYRSLQFIEIQLCPFSMRISSNSIHSTQSGYSFVRTRIVRFSQSVLQSVSDQSSNTQIRRHSKFKSILDLYVQRFCIRYLLFCNGTKITLTTYENKYPILTNRNTENMKICTYLSFNLFDHWLNHWTKSMINKKKLIKNELVANHFILWGRFVNLYNFMYFMDLFSPNAFRLHWKKKNCKKHKHTVENIDEKKKNKTKKLRDDMKTKKNV